MIGSKKIFFTMLPTIVALAWPTVLEQVMQTAVQYIDTAMVGSLGKQATAAIGATSTVNWLVGSTVSALSVGFLSYISQSMGAGLHDKVKKASGQSVTTVIIVGIIFTVLTTTLSGVIPIWMQVDENIREMASRYFLILYSPMLFRTASIIFGTVLRSVGDTKSPMKAGIIVNIINVALNFLFIYPTRTVSLFGSEITLFGTGWGIEGAAAASAIAYTMGGIIIAVTVWHHKDISPKGQKLRPDPVILKSCLRVAIPNMLQRFATSLGFVAFASMINSLGETATAAHTIANTVESAFYIPGYGMQTAAATLSGNACGAKNKERLSDLAKTAIPFVVFLMIISGSLLFIFAPQLVSLFSDDSEVISLGTTVLRMVAVSEPFFGVPIVIEGIMQGAGKTITPFIFNVLGMWCVRIVGTFICTQILGYGLVSAWACMIGHNLLLFVLFISHYATGRWKPKYMD